MYIRALEEELADTLDELGLKFNNNIDGEEILKLCRISRLNDLTDLEERNKILHIVISYIAQGIKIKDYQKITEPILPKEMENKFGKLLTKHIRIDFDGEMDKKYSCVVKSVDGLHNEYKELFPYLSDSWEITVSFAYDSDLDRIAANCLATYITKNAKYIKTKLDAEIPDIVGKYLVNKNS